MNYRDEVEKAMTMLSCNGNVIFLGQSIKYSGHAMFGTLKGVPMDRRLELPVAEEMQMGMSIGLALEGFLPVSIYPRMDFLLLAVNQLVNHLDKIEAMSRGQFTPKVIIRTMVGSKSPLDGGLQHTQDHTQALRKLLTNINVVKLNHAEDVVDAYMDAANSVRSTILIEIGDLY